MSARIGVVTFPGSLDDRDALRAVELMGGEGVPLWHADRDLRGVDGVVVPGGFSYGDYLRCGAIASFAPLMDEIRGFAERGGPVLGICNGFQILCEAGLLPGALARNRSLRFVCRLVHVRVETSATPVTFADPTGISLPMSDSWKRAGRGAPNSWRWSPTRAGTTTARLSATASTWARLMWRMRSGSVRSPLAVRRSPSFHAARPVSSWSHRALIRNASRRMPLSLAFSQSLPR